YPSILVSDYELEQVRRRLALDARHPDTVGAHGIQAQRSKVRNGIRHEVIARIGNLVDQMLLDREGIDAPPRARQLGDIGAAVTAELRDGEADLAHARHIGET